MKKIKSRKLLALYGCSGMGVNMMNLMVGSYLCSALLTGGFAPEDIGTWTYVDKNLVVATLWAALAFAARVLDGAVESVIEAFLKGYIFDSGVGCAAHECSDHK